MTVKFMCQIVVFSTRMSNCTLKTALFNSQFLAVDRVGVEYITLPFRWHFNLFQRPVLAFGYCLYVWGSFCLSVCASVNPELVHAITHHPFKLEPSLFRQICKTDWLRSLCCFFFFFFGGGGGGNQIWFENPNSLYFELAKAITHQPLKLKPPKLDKSYKTACWWYLLFWGWLTLTFKVRFNLLILNPTGYNTWPVLRSRLSPNLRPELDHRCSMPLLFFEPITSNIGFAVNHRWTFRSMVDIAIDLFTSEDRYFLWITAVPLCVYNLDCIWDPRVCATRYLVTSWDFNTPKFYRNYREKYGTLTRRPIHNNAK